MFSAQRFSFRRLYICALIFTSSPTALFKIFSPSFSAVFSLSFCVTMKIPCSFLNAYNICYLNIHPHLSCVMIYIMSHTTSFFMWFTAPKGATPVRPLQLTDKWQRDGIMCLPLLSIKCIKVDFLNRIHYLSIK